MLITKTVLMDDAAISRSLKRISHEIIERNRGGSGLPKTFSVSKGKGCLSESWISRFTAMM